MSPLAALQIAVERCGKPRDKFVELFPEHETDLSWTEKTAAASCDFGPTLERSLLAIQAEQRKVIDIELKGALPLQQLKKVNLRMISAESKMRQAKQETIETNLCLMISIATNT